jgi:Zn-dependent metalloprotease
VYDVHHGGQNSLPGQRVWAEGDQPTQDDSVNEAFDGAGKTFEFYEQTFSRNSIDGQGKSSHLTSASTLTTRSGMARRWRTATAVVSCSSSAR